MTHTLNSPVTTLGFLLDEAVLQYSQGWFDKEVTMKRMKIGMAAVTLLTVGLLAGCESTSGHEGAVVGGAVGAAGGALIGSAAAGSGNRGTGALIGGVVGGAAGAVAGDQLHDKKK
jgi:hypothetical protein